MFDDKELSKTDIIILEADGRINDKNNGYGQPIKKRLSEMEIDSKIVSLVENSAHLDKLPNKPLIISGGMTEVTKKIDWINQSKNFLRKKIMESQANERIPLLGICFGAQLIAESFQEGSVMYLDTPEIGASKIKLNKPNHKLLKGFKNEFNAYSFHYNQIKTEHFTVISSSKIQDNEFIQIFQIPNTTIFGVQFHPEFNINEMKSLFETYKNLITKLGKKINDIINNLPDLKNNWLIFKNLYYY